METINESSGNVFADLGFSPEESVLLAMRAELMARLRETIAERVRLNRSHGMTTLTWERHLGHAAGPQATAPLPEPAGIRAGAGRA